MNTKEVSVYDTTLRDGLQGANVHSIISPDTKRAIAEELFKIGVREIEGGWPGAHPADTQFFRQMVGPGIPIFAFGMTRGMNLKVENDPQVHNLLESRAEKFTLVGKSSIVHVRKALETTGEENLAAIYETIAFLLKNGAGKIYFDAEHFFDGFKQNQEYSLKVLETARKAGADTLVLCDTNGGSTYDFIGKTVKAVRDKLGPDIKLGIHAHNDRGLALPNSIEAIKAGATQVQVTVNGMGERTGNANLCEVVPLLELSYEYSTGIKLSGLTDLSKFVARATVTEVPENAPWVGRNAFAHKGGLHGSAVKKDPTLYEQANPEIVGNKRKIINSEQGGGANIRKMAEDFGFTLSKEDVKLLTQEMKKTGELGKAQAYLMFHRYFHREEPFKILNQEYHSYNSSLYKAILELSINGNIQDVVGKGISHLNASDNALKKALSPIYPEINEIKLSNYKTYVPEDLQQYRTDAEVIVRAKYVSNGDEWDSTTKGVDEVAASFQNLVDSYMYCILSKTPKT